MWTIRTNLSKVMVVGALGFLAMFLWGCSGNGKVETVSEKEEKHYQRAQRLNREGRHEEAMSAYLKVIDKRRESPESHLEVGRLYLEHINDPIAAIYHFRKYLETKPNAEQSPMVRQMIETAQKAFARLLPGKPYDNDIDRLDLMEMLQQVRDENLALKKQLAELTRGRGNRTKVVASKEKKTEEPTFAPLVEMKPILNPKAQFYTVQVGDTLSKISANVYGSSTHWEMIYNANKDGLRNAHDLKVGQVLKIPAI